MGKTVPEQVNWVEVPDQSVLEDVGTNVQDKAVEDLVPVSTDGAGDERSTLIGTSMPDWLEADVIKCLRRNKEIFAYSTYEMPGMDPEFIRHELNARPECKPVVQKPRRSAATHTDAVLAEVDRLTEAGAIREVQYPT